MNDFERDGTMEFRKIDESNYWDCLTLDVETGQKHFAAYNIQKLLSKKNYIS